MDIGLSDDTVWGSVTLLNVKCPGRCSCTRPVTFLAQEVSYEASMPAANAAAWTSLLRGVGWFKTVRMAERLPLDTAVHVTTFLARTRSYGDASVRPGPPNPSSLT